MEGLGFYAYVPVSLSPSPAQAVSSLRAGHVRAVIAALSEVSLKRVLPDVSLLPPVILATYSLILFYYLIHY